MIDRDQLRRDLEWVDERRLLPTIHIDDLKHILEAARLVADPDTLTIQWCEEHNNQMSRLPEPDSPKDRGLCFFGEVGLIPRNGRQLCRMVERILLEGQPK